MSDNDFDQLKQYHDRENRRRWVSDALKTFDMRQRTSQLKPADFAIYGTPAEFERMRRQIEESMQRAHWRHWSNPFTILHFERIDDVTFDLFVAVGARPLKDAIRVVMPNAEAAESFAAHLDMATHQQ